MKKTDISVKILLFVICAGLFMYHLGSALPIIESEKFYYQSVKEMFARHDWITPYYQGQFRFQKPILFYWLVSLSYLVFGIDNFGVRFPSALFAILSVIFTFNIGRKLFDRKTGLLSAGILATTLLFFMYARYASPDMALTFFIVYSIYLFLKGSKSAEGQKGFFMAFFAVLGLSMMNKGLAGVILPLIIVLAFIISTKKWKLLKSLNLPYGIIVVLAIGLPWYILMYILHGDRYFNFMIMRDAFQKFFLGPNNETGLAFLAAYFKNILYYIPVFLVWFLPYSPFLPAALVDSFKSKNTYSLERDSYKLILCYFLGIFLFFFVSFGREYYYFLPLAPGFSLLLARYFINLEERKRLFKSAGFGLVYILVIIAYSLVLLGVLYTMQHIYSAKVAVYEYLIALAPMILIIPYIRKRKTSTLFAIPIAMTILMLFLAGRAVPLFNDKVLPSFADRIKKNIGPGDKVGVGSVDISRERLGIHLDVPIEEVNVKSKSPDAKDAHKEKLEKFITSGSKIYLVIAEDDYITLIPDNIKKSLIILDEREMWKTRLKRSLTRDAAMEALKGKRDFLKDILRHRVYLLTNKK